MDKREQAIAKMRVAGYHDDHEANTRADKAEEQLTLARQEIRELYELVAVANGDGGHYREQYGTKAAVERGIQNIVEHFGDVALSVLAELVELKRMKERIAEMAFGSTQEAGDFTEEYERRKPPAWKRAEEIVDGVQPNVQIVEAVLTAALAWYEDASIAEAEDNENLFESVWRYKNAMKQHRRNR